MAPIVQPCFLYYIAELYFYSLYHYRCTATGISKVLHVVFYISKCVYSLFGTRSQLNLLHFFKCMVQELKRKWFLYKISPTNHSSQFDNEAFLHVELSCFLEIKKLDGDGKNRNAQGMSNSMAQEFFQLQIHLSQNFINHKSSNSVISSSSQNIQVESIQTLLVQIFCRTSLSSKCSAI